jgi:hypothetical protein
MSVAAPAEAAFSGTLAAAGPHPEHATELMLFGQFVGEWEFEWACYGDTDERVLTEQGEWIFAWVLEGRAIQDVWIIPGRDRRDRPDAPAGEYGTTIRVYDPQLDAWLVTWHGPINRARRLFIAREIGSEIVLDGQTEQGHPMRWVFSEITERSFRWSSVVSTDEERTWQLREEMDVRRR